MWFGPRHPLPSIVRFDKSFRNRANIIITSLSRSLSLSFSLFNGVYPKIFRNSVLRYIIYRYKYRGERLLLRILQNSQVPPFSLSLSLFLISQTGKKHRKRFSDSRKWFKRLCWLTRRSWTKFHQESHGSSSFPSARSLYEEKAFLQHVKWKNSCISFSLSRALPSSHLTFSPSTACHHRFRNSYNFFLSFFLHFFSLDLFFA